MLPADKLFQDVKLLVLSARQNAYRVVDAERVLLNWQVGQRIRNDILQNQRAEFGKQVIKTLAERLVAEFGNTYNRYNLWLYVRFAADFPDGQIVDALRQLFTWTHLRIFLRLEDDLKRRFYMEMCRIEGWGTRQLEERIDSMLYERTAISGKPNYTPPSLKPKPVEKRFCKVKDKTFMLLQNPPVPIFTPQTKKRITMAKVTTTNTKSDILPKFTGQS